MAGAAKRVSTAVEIKSRPPGMHVVGGGLYLSVNEPTAGNPKGSRQWIFRFTSPLTGKRREMGMGAAGDGGLLLAEARDKAADLKRLVTAGLDPIEEQRTAKAAAAAAPATAPTFGKFADDWLDLNEGQFANTKHRAQWRMTLEKYAGALRAKELPSITTSDVVSALEPIWTTKPETAKRTQGRIERVLDAAKARGLLSGDNPARWRGHLSHLLPKQGKLTRGHHAALPYKELGAFIERLRVQEGTAARALEFLILTAARSGEVRGATWEEVDLDARRWTVPAHRMKAKKEHRVPLCDRAIAILNQLAEDHGKEGLVFPGAAKGTPMSDMTLAAVLKRMKRNDITVHGFRSTFRDWAEDVSGFSFGIFKAALAHAIADKTDAAYRRGDAFEKRTKLMSAWANYAEKVPADAKVIPIRA